MSKSMLVSVLSVAALVLTLAASNGKADDKVEGKLRETVNFGVPDPGSAILTEEQEHKLLPEEVHLKSWQGSKGKGGVVNFVVSGSRRHQVGIYKVAKGTKLESIKAQIADPANNEIRDKNNTLIFRKDEIVNGYIDSNPSALRYYVGPNPGLAPVAGTFAETNRIEPVTFVEPGYYLVVCLRPGHLGDAMVGLVKAQ